jgi:SNF2 family DNA or RNA helicase
MLKPLWKDFQYQEHQTTGIQWMLTRESKFPSGGILCDEMGLGKTIQVLGVMKASSAKKTLLLAPLCTLDQWQKTAERCGFCVWRCNAKESSWDVPAQLNPSAKQLYLVNYERAIARKHLVIRKIWDRVVFDEAHRLGVSESQSYKLADSIDAENKWFLTATPIVNRVENVISLFSLLGYTKIPKHLKDMAPMIQESVLCRKMNDLRDRIPSLPNPAQEYFHHLDFDSEEEEEFYRGIQGVLQRRWKALETESNAMTERFRLIMRLRQISIHPQVYISARKKEWAGYTRADFHQASTKFNGLENLIMKGATKPHKWIVFCHFREEMTLLQEFLEDCPVVRECHIYNGGLTMEEKTEVIQKTHVELQGIQQEVLLVQLQSGGVGLNLQHCDRVVFMGPWWTAALMDQAVGRAVRIGQTEQVEVHHLVLKEEETMNIDKHMLEAAETKRSLCCNFLSMASTGTPEPTPLPLPKPVA